MAIGRIAVAGPRPLPILVLADTSGSMASHGKIDGLNHGIGELLRSLASDDEAVLAEPNVGVITFGGHAAEVHTPIAPARTVRWSPAVASGMTPMGAAFAIAREVVEDRAQVPGNAFRPVLVLVSDGQPNDDWESALDALLQSDRASKADRFALAIGPDADRAMLAKFTGDREKVLDASGAADIHRFFRFVTMSVQARSRSVTPNAVVTPPALSFDDLR